MLSFKKIVYFCASKKIALILGYEFYSKTFNQEVYL